MSSRKIDHDWRGVVRRCHTQSVAVIRQFGRYPVKSMRGVSLAATTLTLQGVLADRRYAFVQTASRSSFPWLTARELPELLCYRTSVEEASPQEVEVVIRKGCRSLARLLVSQYHSIFSAAARRSMVCPTASRPMRVTAP
jgi:uncharacterized protein YcbX